MRERKGAFGVVYQDVARSEKLSIEAKGIYCYLAALSGSTSNESYPSISLMCKELKMSKTRLYKHMSELVQFGVVKKTQTYNGNIKGKMIYSLTHEVNFSCIPQNGETEKQDNSFSPNLGIQDSWNTRDEEINNNNINNNNINNNNINNNSASPDAPKESNAEIESFFESIWKLYPNKKGKSAVSKTKKKELFKVGYDEMSRAISRYVTDLKAEEWRKPQYGSSFFNKGYVDYLDANYQAPDTNEPEKGDRSIYDPTTYEQEVKRALGIE